MNTVFGSKHERGFKGLVFALVSSITLLAVSTAALLVVTLLSNASADGGITYTGTAPTCAQTVAANQAVNASKLVLFPSSNLKGALK